MDRGCNSARTNPVSTPKPLPGCSELLPLHLAHPLPCAAMFWCLRLAESCPNTVITTSNSSGADLVFSARGADCENMSENYKTEGKKKPKQIKRRKKKFSSPVSAFP